MRNLLNGEWLKIDAPGPYYVRFALMVARPERFWNLRLFSPRRDAARLPLPGCVKVFIERAERACGGSVA